MALSILDGNQTATTLSTIVTSGQHIPAHTIVSLGAQAVTDISTAVGLLQSAVATQGSVANTAFVKIGGHTGAATTGNIVHVSSVGAMKVDASASTQPIFGTVAANIFGQDGTGNPVNFEIGIVGGDNVTNAIPIGFNDVINNFSIVSSNSPLPVSGTVTIGSIPNGALTTRFGSITTANTAFATTAVTNASRKYLMIQNIASTVITAGIGFTPTTTQGIQLVAGATITYDGNYIPTGAVRILSSVTASNFTVLEA